jgi:hypothetical protein
MVPNRQSRAWRAIRVSRVDRGVAIDRDNPCAERCLDLRDAAADHVVIGRDALDKAGQRPIRLGKLQAAEA